MLRYVAASQLPATLPAVQRVSRPRVDDAMQLLPMHRTYLGFLWNSADVRALTCMQGSHAEAEQQLALIRHESATAQVHIARTPA